MNAVRPYSLLSCALARVRPLAVALIALMMSACAAAHAATLEVGGKGGSKTIAAALSRAKAGDVVHIRAGVYPGGFKVTTGVAIKADPGALITLDPKQTIAVKGADDAELDGLIVRVSGQAAAEDSAAVVSVSGSKNVRISNCRLTVAGGWGIDIRGSSNIIIAGCSISGSGRTGVFVEGDKVLVNKVTVTGFDYGVGVRSGKEIAVVNSLMDANLSGVTVADGQVDIVDNTINGPGSTAIEVKGGSVVIAGNAVRRYEYGVMAHAGGRGEITGNTLSQNLVGAVVIYGPAYRVARNVVSHNGGHAILVQSTGDWPVEGQAEVVNNMISGNAGNGIYVGDGVRAVVRQNILENNRSGAFVDKGAIELTHNTIVLNTGYGLVSSGSARVKLRGNIIANNQQGIFATADTDFDSEGNVVYGHILRGGFTLYDVNYLSKDWMPTLSGDTFQVKVMPSGKPQAPSDLNIDPGFVKLGADYRLRPDSEILKHFGEDPPGALPVVRKQRSPQ